MTFEDKAEIVISQLRKDRDRLEKSIKDMRAEIEQLEVTCSEEHGCIKEILQIIDKHTKECDTLRIKDDAVENAEDILGGDLYEGEFENR